jgi:osmotically-inducible protein OsmY
MSSQRLVYIAALSAALGCTVVTVGCGSTPTQSSLGEVVDDSVITSKVKAAFVEDAQVSAFNISVETVKGHVQLSGFVDSVNEKARAAELARNVKGVKMVSNDIQVKNQG